MTARCPHGCPWFAACAVCDEAEILDSWERLPPAFWVDWSKMSPEVRAMWQVNATDYSLWKEAP